MLRIPIFTDDTPIPSKKSFLIAVKAAPLYIPVTLSFWVFRDGEKVFLLVCAAKSRFFAGFFAGFFGYNVLFTGGIHLVLLFYVVHALILPMRQISFSHLIIYIATNEPGETSGGHKCNRLILQSNSH